MPHAALSKIIRIFCISGAGRFSFPCACCNNEQRATQANHRRSSRMKNERQQKIIKLLWAHEALSTQALAHRLAVSQETIRRDKS
ncbi:DeoR family transcriptional regulator, partial [Cronobacter sakazakii]|nr:DeoR family transcriptional regulator [Cronobacter sakazakii]